MILLALVSLGLTLVAPAVAYAQPAQAQPAEEQPAPEEQPDPPQPAALTRTEYLVERLREDPVFVSDHIPRAIGPADEERIREILAATGVPTYLVALPDHQGEPSGEPLLAALHDRLGADGLYVYMSATGIYLDAVAYGHDLPTTAAARAVTFEMTHEHGPVERMERFVEVLTSDEAEAIYDEAYARSQAEEPGDPLLTPEDQAFLAGTAASGVPLAALAVAWFVRRARRRRRAAAEAVAT
jgi:hypothetical protein